MALLDIFTLCLCCVFSGQLVLILERPPTPKYAIVRTGRIRRSDHRGIFGTMSRRGHISRDCCRLAGLVFREIVHAVVKYAMAAYATRGQSKTTVQCVQWHMCINVETRLTYTLPRQIGRDYDK